MWSNWHLKRSFNYLNRRYWRGRLPSIKVRYGSCPNCPRSEYMGCVTGRRMVLAPWLRRSGKCTLMVMLHEMAHLKFIQLGQLNVDHGPRWRREMRRLHQAGAFNAFLYSP